MLDQDHGVLSRCCRIMEIAQTCIDKGIFSNGSEMKEVLNIIMMEARDTMIYYRQHQSPDVEALTP